MPPFTYYSKKLLMLAFVGAALAISCTARAQNQFDLNEQTFNQWLYGNARPAGIADELSAEIEGIDRICNLTRDQKAKLKLAGRGDEVRFNDRVAELRENLVGKSYEQNEINDVYQQIQPLAAQYKAGVLGKSSLFHKVLRRTLLEEQLEDFERVQAERRKERHEARIRLFIVQLERSCPLTDEQRTSLMEILQKETRPASRASEYESYVLLFQASKIPDERFEKLFDEAQLRVVKAQFQQGQGMEQFLRQQGLLPEVENEDDADD